MKYKFCENHLTELYDAIKSGNIAKVEKIEHELSSQEECVACAYALKAKGGVRQELLGFLASQGFGVETSPKSNFWGFFRFWIIHIAVFVSVFFVSVMILDSKAQFPLNLIYSIILSVIALLIFSQLFG